jgi:hypothetical protein
MKTTPETRIGIDSLPRESHDDIVMWMTETMPERGDEYSIRHNLIGIVDEPFLVAALIPVSEIEVSPTRGVSELAVKNYSARPSHSAPPIILNGLRLLEGGHRLAAAKLRGDASIYAVDIKPLIDMNWAEWLDGGPLPSSLQRIAPHPLPMPFADMLPEERGHGPRP